MDKKAVFWIKCNSAARGEIWGFQSILEESDVLYDAERKYNGIGLFSNNVDASMFLGIVLSINTNWHFTRYPGIGDGETILQQPAEQFQLMSPTTATRSLVKVSLSEDTEPSRPLSLNKTAKLETAFGDGLKNRIFKKRHIKLHCKAFHYKAVKCATSPNLLAPEPTFVSFWWAVLHDFRWFDQCPL